jgi:hypothetical protein
VLYGPPAGRPVLVDVPELSFLMVDGEGDPNLSQDYRDAVQALFAVSHAVKRAVKFAVKRAGGVAYRVSRWRGCGGSTTWQPSPSTTRPAGSGPR